MIRLTDEAARKRILEMLKRNIEECLYLAIDFEVYGLGNPNVEFYYSDEEETIAMKYYDSFQLFTCSEKWNPERCAEFIAGFRVREICGKESMIRKLENLLPDYYTEYGIVIADNRYREFEQFKKIQNAVPEDAWEIARLICSTEEFRPNYDVDVLARQLKDRMLEGRGRNYIIREDNKIVAHTAIYAECGDAAVESGLVVDEEYKRKFYGMIIHEYIKKVLTEENKTLYGLRYNDEMQHYAKAENLDVRAHCGRMILRG